LERVATAKVAVAMGNNSAEKVLDRFEYNFFVHCFQDCIKDWFISFSIG
jgi:hypothetical protein